MTNENLKKTYGPYFGYTVRHCPHCGTDFISDDDKARCPHCQTETVEREDARVCTHCGAIMEEGYLVQGGLAYYDKDECLHQHITATEWDELYDDAGDDNYWTSWAE
ncbi:hypothetical protein ACT26D_06420 [Megasphaera elsdenii]|uniref:hypothetical protein n=1 Tax=Megasphaera elsdenii TaxID=907 RepID=UPI004036FE1A